MPELGWEPIDGKGDLNPYVAWWRDFEEPRFPKDALRLVQTRFSPQRLFGSELEFSEAVQSAVAFEAKPSAISVAAEGMSARRAADLGLDAQYGGSNPLPAQASNDSFEPGADPTGHITLNPEDIPPDDAVITGVIDAAIAIGHQRFCYRSGRHSRVLAAWQQSAPANGDQPYLPFGRELLKPEIDRLLARHTHAGGSVDEEGFNRDAELVDMMSPVGQRELNHDIAHGTHVMDLAAGFDPTDPEVTDAMLKKRPIIAINMPNRYLIGSAGIFLELFVIEGIKRIVAIADHIWSLGQNRRGDDRGYPIVINLSYGLQAGPKDGSMLLEKYISRLVSDRRDEGKAPVRFVLPAGNENLERGNAIWQLKRRAKDFWWRILPEDQTSNYLEIWTDDLNRTDPLPLKISVTPPGHDPTPLEVGGDNHQRDIGGFARLYCQRREVMAADFNGNVKTRLRQRYLLCVAPTLQYGDPGTPEVPALREAPSGRWKITVQVEPDAYPDGLDVFMNVQSDQTTRPGGQTGLISYLDHPKYEVYEEHGAPKDTYVFSRDNLSDSKANQEPNNREGPVQRKGTLNAIASSHVAIVVAGHRSSEGRPAPYSSSGSGERLKASRPSPTVSYPSDDGPAHPGLIAAGSRSGSAVTMQGTSFATAQATRDLVERLADWRTKSGGDPDAELPADMRALAQATDPNDGKKFGRIFSWKSGYGRMPAPPTQRKPRLET